MTCQSSKWKPTARPFAYASAIASPRSSGIHHPCAALMPPLSITPRIDAKRAPVLDPAGRRIVDAKGERRGQGFDAHRALWHPPPPHVILGRRRDDQRPLRRPRLRHHEHRPRTRGPCGRGRSRPVRGRRELSFRAPLPLPERPGRPPSIEAGPAAIARYLDAGAEGRLIQSVKSFLATRAFHETTICDQRWTLEQLVGLLLERLRRAAEAQVGDLGRRAVVGRPVHFAGPGRPGDDDVAEARLRAGLARAGFDDVTFVLEPVAAAYHYERGLDHDELVFIADFGGGTSDFSVLRVGPGARRDGAGARRVLASDGVGIAGDVFDAQIVRRAVSPALGRGTRYETRKGLEVPLWIFGHLEQWRTLSMLKTPRTLQLLRRLHHDAVEPEKIGALLHLVDDDLGFALHRAVDGVKQALSREDGATLSFADPPLRLEQPIARADLETWIARPLAAIAECANRTLEAADVVAADVDRVFMTGGSSFR